MGEKKEEVEHFTRWMHVENGKSFVRRLHRIELQAADGRLHVITGDKLPDAMVTNAGHGHRGAHMAQILLKPNKIGPITRLWNGREFEPDRRWPTSRDAIQWIIGMLFVGFLNFISTATF